MSPAQAPQRGTRCRRATMGASERTPPRPQTCLRRRTLARHCRPTCSSRRPSGSVSCATPTTARRARCATCRASWSTRQIPCLTTDLWRTRLRSSPRCVRIPRRASSLLPRRFPSRSPRTLRPSFRAWRRSPRRICTAFLRGSRRALWTPADRRIWRSSRKSFASLPRRRAPTIRSSSFATAGRACSSSAPTCASATSSTYPC